MEEIKSIQITNNTIKWIEYYNKTRVDTGLTKKEYEEIIEESVRYFLTTEILILKALTNKLD